ncbi:MAG: putative selenium-dependent hydroxylase accessory protein YqeC [Chloroflexi bacterium]|nr:MAG: putative selenium-dependent hydroxylase accessory protein YqeC [Chloroflexota bacterium]
MSYPVAQKPTLAQALRLHPGDVAAFVGGGGKSTAMFRLARELSASMRVLATTTTRIFAVQISQSPAHVTADPARPPANLTAQLDTALRRHGQVLLTGPVDPAQGKAFGVPPEQVDQLAASGQFDVILVEADGSRMRPFKAPAQHEPVIPATTTLVVPVAGLDVLGQPLNAQTVHRPQRVARLAGLPLDAPITAGVVATVLAHPDGGLKNVPPSARVAALLNKAETEARQSAGQTIAAQLLARPRIESVVLGRVRHAAAPVVERRERAAVVLLAAGGSSRFGAPKQLATWGGVTLVERAADVALASQADGVTVVLGAHAAACRAALGRRPVQIVVNTNWAQGQSTSLRAGLEHLPAGTGSAIFLPVDMPGITPDVLNALITCHRQTLAPLVWPEFEGQRGNPVLFDRDLFGQLAQISGDTGGRALFKKYARQAGRVAANSAEILHDVDRPEDFYKMTDV